MKLLLLIFISIKWTLFATDLSSKITLITVCSPCPSYPNTIFLQIAQHSLVLNVPQFSNIPKIIVCDGVKNNIPNATYEAYKLKLANLVAVNPQFSNTKLVFCKEWQCFAGAVHEALKHVTTEYIFLHQDDFMLNLPINLEGLIDAMDKNHSIKLVRFNQCQNPAGPGLGRGYEAYVDHSILGGSDFPLLRTPVWSDNDHIARKDYYDTFIFPLFIKSKKTFLEAELMTPSFEMFAKDKDEHSRYFGTYLYGSYNEGPYLIHLDRKSNAWLYSQ